MRASSRGLTLIELLVTVAVASIIILAATQAVVVVAQAKRVGEQRVEVTDAATTALGLIQFDALNAGYRFASPVFAVRVLNNVAGTEAELGGITASANCGPATWGIMPGTDTLELRFGSQALVPGTDSDVNCGGTGACTVTLAGGGARNPFPSPPAPAEGNGDLVLLTNSTAACLGRVTANVASSNMTMQLLGLDLSTAGTTAFPGCASGTFTVMRLERRVRYMVCRPPAGNPQLRPGLFQQVSLNAGAFSAPTLVQEGIEDLQVALRYDNSPTPPPTSTVLLAGAGCAGGRCICNMAPADCGAGFTMTPSVVDSTFTALAERQVPFRLRGLEVGVTAVSMRTQLSAAQRFRPALFDHPAGTVASSDNWRSRRMSLTLPNITQVNP